MLDRRIREEAGFSISRLGSYRLVCPVDPDQEEELCHKQAEAQVFVDGISVTLKPTEEAEGEEADQEADEREEDADPGNHIQEQIMGCTTMLQTQKGDNHPSALHKQSPSGGRPAGLRQSDRFSHTKQESQQLTKGAGQSSRFCYNGTQPARQRFTSC